MISLLKLNYVVKLLLLIIIFFPTMPMEGYGERGQLLLKIVYCKKRKAVLTPTLKGSEIKYLPRINLSGRSN